MKMRDVVIEDGIPLRVTIDVRPTKEYLKTSVERGDISVEYLEEVIRDVLENIREYLNDYSV